ncbi:hypothetical protein [Leptolyngbya sp. AN03gr2]|uniref:hypothetical protein n=1 Tax=Leptolyngbya sp. AN03gr2 TaxID=3423364 RepID=UPI003D318FE5
MADYIGCSVRALEGYLQGDLELDELLRGFYRGEKSEITLGKVKIWLAEAEGRELAEVSIWIGEILKGRFEQENAARVEKSEEEANRQKG